MFSDPLPLEAEISLLNRESEYQPIASRNDNDRHGFSIPRPLMTRASTPEEKIEKDYHSKNNRTYEIPFRVHKISSLLNSL